MRAQGYSEWWRPGTPQAQAPLAPEAGLPAGVQGSMLPFWALLAFTFVLLLSPQAQYPVLQPLQLAKLTALLALVAHAYNSLSLGRPFAAMVPAMWYVALLVGWAVLTLPFSYWAGGSLSFMLNTWFKTLVVFVLLANVVDSLPKLRKLSWGLVLMAVPLAWTTVRNFASGQMLGGERVLGYESGLTGNPNDMALMLNLILPFAVALFLYNTKASRRLLLGGIIVLLVAAIIATFSRAGFLALAFIFMIYMWRLRKRPERIWAPVVLVLALASLPFLPASYSDRLTTITNVESDETGSAQVRLRDLKAATVFTLQHPLVGAGIGQNILAMNEIRGSEWLKVHNVYLEYSMELGLPGLILFLLLMGACFRNTREVMKRSAALPDGGELYYLAEALRVSLFAFALEALFHPVAYHFYFYYIAGLAIALPVVCRTQEGRTDQAAGKPQE